MTGMGRPKVGDGPVMMPMAVPQGVSFMTENHIGRRAGCFFYSMLPGFASLCAPEDMPNGRAGLHVSAFAPPAPGWRWVVFDRGRAGRTRTRVIRTPATGALPVGAGGGLSLPPARSA
jgi:hypothetical protein